jgi:1-deoxy-D-xylulose-5-phosphate reductoisomerase
MLSGPRTGLTFLDLAKAGTLRFEAPDTRTFPCLDLARQALRQNLCVELNAANEIAVERFLAGDISFPAIAGLVETILNEAVATSPAVNYINNGEGCDPLERIVASLEQRDTLTRNRAREWREP